MSNTSNIPKSPRLSTPENLLQLCLRDHYDILRELGRGTYGKVVLAKCRETGINIALKILPKSHIKLKEFQREFNLSYFLSPHTNIVDLMYFPMSLISQRLSGLQSRAFRKNLIKRGVNFRHWEGILGRNVRKGL
jgi:serine/threonine protein kinase